MSFELMIYKSPVGYATSRPRMQVASGVYNVGVYHE